MQASLANLTPPPITTRFEIIFNDLFGEAIKCRKKAEVYRTLRDAVVRRSKGCFVERGANEES